MKMYKVFGLFLGLVSLSFLLQSCTMSQASSRRQSISYQESEEARYRREQERLRREYGRELEMAAQQMVKAFSDELSPRSGKDWRANVLLYDYEIVENVREGYVACYAVLHWMARDFWSGVKYDWCELQGTLYFYPKLRSVDRMKASFYISRSNEQVRAVSSESKWNKVQNGLTIEL